MASCGVDSSGVVVRHCDVCGCVGSLKEFVDWDVNEAQLGLEWSEVCSQVGVGD